MSSDGDPRAMTSATGTVFVSPRQSDRLLRAPGNWSRAWRRFRANRLVFVAMAVAGLLIVMTLAAPLIVRYISHVGPDAQSLLTRFAGPSRVHWLGTDELGRDELTRLAYGGQVSLVVAVVGAVVHVLVGTLVGAIAGFYGGWIDAVLMRIVDVLLSIPTIYILVMLGALISFGPISLAIAVAIFSWFGLARLIRTQILSIKESEYVLAARVVGASDARILGRHILPNVTFLIILSTTSAIPAFVLAETALSFLGLGIQPPTPSWGNILNNATQYLYDSKLLLIVPGVCIWLLVLSLTVIGYALRDAIDPRSSGR